MAYCLAAVGVGGQVHEAAHGHRVVEADAVLLAELLAAKLAAASEDVVKCEEFGVGDDLVWVGVRLHRVGYALFQRLGL